MAEYVQKNLEDMLPELEYMKRLRLFTADEVTRILKMRKGFEYKIRRRTKIKDDFISYIQYECNLLTLVRERQRIMGYSSRRTQIDYSIILRVQKLFKMAESRFQGDMKLWMSHIQFSRKVKDFGACSSLFARMLQVHSTKPILWIMYAKFEFEESNSSDSARSLMQRGLRFNPESTLLWSEYFRLELLFAEKMKKRQEILRGAEESVQDAVMDGHVAEIVFKQAMLQITDNAVFALSFVKISEEFEFASSLSTTIMDYILLTFPENPQVWLYEATRAIRIGQVYNMGAHKSDDQGYSVMEKRLESHGSAVWDCYLTVCKNLTEEEGGADNDSADRRASKLLSVLGRAEKDGGEVKVGGEEKVVLSENWYLVWTDMLQKVALPEKSVDVAERAVEIHPTSVLLHKKRLITVWLYGDQKKLRSKFTEALNTVKAEESLPLWMKMVDFYLAQGDREKTEEIYKLGMHQCKEVSGPLNHQYLSWAVMTGGLSKCRAVYKRIKSCPPVPLRVTLAYIKEETNLSGDVKRIGKAYEDAILDHGSCNADLWIEYIQWQNSECKELGKASMAEWKARKALSGQLLEEFTEKLALTKVGAL